MPPGLGSHLKPEWFKCQPPPPGATTPQFHLEISASDINMEDHQLIIQRGWLLLESSLVLFPVCVALMLMCSTGRGGRKRAAAENKKRNISCEDHLFVPPLGPQHDEPSKDQSLIMNGDCFAGCYGALADIRRE